MADDEINAFTRLLLTFLTLFKSNNYTIAEIISKNKKHYKKLELQRNNLFLEIFEPILQKYNAHLKSIGHIDFSDMINQATGYIIAKKVSPQYKYIIVDEFQDISIGRFNLLKSIQDSNPGCKVFCVGDDWQSIYRFSGSDISIFTEFESKFGVTVKSFIETTYRFNASLINTSSEFILKNSKQIKKELKSKNLSQSNPVQILYTDQNVDTQAVIAALKEINASMLQNGKFSKVLVIGRYTRDLDPIKDDYRNFTVSYLSSLQTLKIKSQHFPMLDIEFLTIHKSKGLEADYVIVLNCSAGKYGFPSEQADDPILNLLLSQADQFPNGEERRLFYVALTRCREKVYLIADAKYPSKFILELQGNNSSTTQPKCPRCHTGHLKETSGTSQNGKPWRNLSCSNWNFGCDYKKWL